MPVTLLHSIRDVWVGNSHIIIEDMDISLSLLLIASSRAVLGPFTRLGSLL